MSAWEPADYIALSRVIVMALGWVAAAYFAYRTKKSWDIQKKQIQCYEDAYLFVCELCIRGDLAEHVMVPQMQRHQCLLQAFGDEGVVEAYNEMVTLFKKQANEAARIAHEGGDPGSVSFDLTMARLSLLKALRKSNGSVNIKEKNMWILSAGVYSDEEAAEMESWRPDHA